MIQSKEINLAETKDIKVNPKNRNKHPKDQIDRLKKIIAVNGFRSPLIVSNRSGLLIAGHGRLEAAKGLGMTQVPVMYQDFESEEQELQCMTADNALQGWSELDFAGLNQDIGDLGPFDLDLLGLKDFQVDVADKAQCDEDDVPEVKEAKTVLGDLYILGNHRLLCGDSTSIDAVDKLMGGLKAEICFTSPPYNLGSNASLRGTNGQGKDSAYRTQSDHKTEEEYLQFLKDWTTLAINNSELVFSNIQILAGNKFIMSDYWSHFKDNLVDIMIWDKEHGPPAMAERVLTSVWEFVFLFSSETNPKKSIKTGPGFRGNVDNIFRLNPVGKKDLLAKDHRAVFPVNLAEHFIDKFSSDSVLDLFGGSGTTLIASEKLNRESFSMELDTHYCDVIVSRFCKYTGATKVIRNGEEIEWAI